MAPAVEFCSVIPASGQTQESHGGPRRAASALCSLCCVEACFISDRLYKERRVLKWRGTLVSEHTRTSLGHFRKLLTRVLTARCSTLALRCWHLLVRLSSLANTHKSRVFIHHLFWCQLSKLGTHRSLFSTFNKVLVVLMLNHFTCNLTSAFYLSSHLCLVVNKR